MKLSKIFKYARSWDIIELLMEEERLISDICIKLRSNFNDLKKTLDLLEREEIVKTIHYGRIKVIRLKNNEKVVLLINFIKKWSDIDG